MTRTVAALCVAGNSIYKAMAGVDAYDMARDARSFSGGVPIVAHPPCRLWSAYCAHQAKSPDPDAERALGIWCADQVRQWGGVLEQPAHSRLFAAAGLPLPGEDRDGEFSVRIEQADFGYSMKKATWLYFRGVDRASLNFPSATRHDSSIGVGDRRRQQVMSKNQRAATHPVLAQFLVDAARTAQ